jgi:hypothetical protein
LLAQPSLGGEIPMNYFRFLLAYFLIFFGLFRVIKDRVLPSFVFLMTFCLLSLMIWQRQFAVARYAVTIEILTPVLLGIVALLYVPYSDRLFKGGIVALSLAMVITFRIPSWGRIPWNRNLFESELPRGFDYSKCAILNAHPHPMSFLIQSFPKNCRLIQVEQNITQPFEQQGPYQRHFTSLLQSDEIRNIYFLKVPDSNLPALAKLGYEIQPNLCKPVKNNLVPNLELCPAHRFIPATTQSKLFMILRFKFS